ncbi:MAG: T9SS type A sorting domain-containing protein [Bacteroidales bacterium]|nr:T9SS type A sorting domain-containing protein [Bacteroidales bacterium]
MKIKPIFIGIIVALLFILAFYNDCFGQICSTCPGNTVSGIQASAFGESNSASGNYSFVAGRNSIANQSNAVVIGSDSRASGGHSYVIGSTTFALGNFSYAFGGNSTSESDFSLVLGHNLISRNGAFVIGKGNVDAKLTNNNQESLMVGFNSAFPTMFVSRTELGFQSGRIGIGNVTAPEAKLHIRADANEPATLQLEATGTSGDNIYSRMLFTPNHSIQAANNQNFTFSTQSSKHFVFQDGNVGIGSSEPLAKLHVADGDVYIEDINHGIIMKSPDGNCWRGRVNNQGQLEFVLLPDCLTTSVSNSKNETKSGIKVHPNPADGYIQFTCSLDDLSNYTSYSILDTRGNLVKKAGLVHVVTIVDTRELPSGTYFIHFEGNQAFWTEKVVIK